MYEWLSYVVYRVQIESGARTKILNTRKLKETFPWLETGKSKEIDGLLYLGLFLD